jgi:hypothetical protein
MNEPTKQRTTTSHVPNDAELERLTAPDPLRLAHDRKILSIQLRAPVTIGTNPTKTLSSGEANSSYNKGLVMTIDWERRMVLFEWDHGSGIAIGETPFENVIGINRGTIVPRPKG